MEINIPRIETETWR